MRAIVEGLSHPGFQGDHHGLVKVMSHLLAIRDRQIATDKMFEPLKDTVILLEQYGVTIPEKVYSQMEVKKEKNIGLLFSFKFQEQNNLNVL